MLELANAQIQRANFRDARTLWSSGCPDVRLVRSATALSARWQRSARPQVTR